MKLLRFLILMVLGTTALAADLAGRWEGVIGPGQLNLEFIVVFDAEDFDGHLSIPAQGMFDHPIGIPETDGASVKFSLPGVPGDPWFVGEQDGDEVAGTFSQSGMDFAFTMMRMSMEGGSGADRPQEPTAPFPYDTQDITVRNGDIELTGTVTIPSDGAQVGVLFITGSGPQDRDSNVFGHKPFLVLADHFTHLGYATARFDDRGVGGSSGDDSAATLEELTTDMVAAAEAFIAETGIAQLIVLGHSQGGYLAPVVAQRVPQSAGVIMLAGPAVPGEDVLLLQNELLIRADAAGAPEGAVQGAIRQQLEFVGAIVEYLKAEDYDGANAHIEAYVRASIEPLPVNARPSEGVLQEVIEAQQAGFVTPAMRSFLLFDPAPHLSTLTLPLLAIYGTHDLQVDAEQSAEPLKAALNAAGNEDVTVVTFGGMNHLMQPAELGTIEEYPLISTTIAEPVLEQLAEWLKARF